MNATPLTDVCLATSAARFASTTESVQVGRSPYCSLEAASVQWSRDHPGALEPQDGTWWLTKCSSGRHDAQKWGYEAPRYCKANKSAEMETLQCGASCFLRTVVKRNHSHSHGSNAATRLQTDSILYLLCLWEFARVLKRCRMRRRQPLIRCRCWMQRPSHAMERFLHMLRRKQTPQKRSRNPQSKKSK